MKKMFRLIVSVLLVAGWSLAALSLHVVRGDHKIVIIPKQSIDWVHGWRETYVDTRNWTLDDVAEHPALVNRLIQTGKVDVLQHVDPQATGMPCRPNCKRRFLADRNQNRDRPGDNPAGGTFSCLKIMQDRCRA